FVEARRLRANPYRQARWQHPAAWVVDLERSRSFSATAHFESQYFITFVWLPPRRAALSRWDHLGEALFYEERSVRRAAGPRERHEMRRDIDRFTRTVDSIVRQLKLIFAHVWELDDGQT